MQGVKVTKTLLNFDHYDICPFKSKFATRRSAILVLLLFMPSNLHIHLTQNILLPVEDSEELSPFLLKASQHFPLS